MSLPERDLWVEIGEFVEERVQRALDARMAGVLSYEGTIATEAAMGTAPIRTMASPNGDTIQEAAVWFCVPEAERTADKAVWLPVERYVTGLAGGNRVVVSRKSTSPQDQDWTVTAKR